MRQRHEEQAQKRRPGKLPHQMQHELRRQPDFMPSMGGATPIPMPPKLAGGPAGPLGPDADTSAAAQVRQSFQQILMWLQMPWYPPCESFEPFFHQWYERIYFPQASQKLHYELMRRAKVAGPLAGAVSQFKGWLMGNTEAFHASVWYESHARSAFPPRFQDCCCFRSATVNLGTRERPLQVTFYGADGRWFLPPWEFVDVDNVSYFMEHQDAAAVGSSASHARSQGRQRTALPPPPPPAPGKSKLEPPAKGLPRGRIGGA